MIHLGFGIEFNQPAIIAEALAQAAVHDNEIGIPSAIQIPFMRATNLSRIRRIYAGSREGCC